MKSNSGMRNAFITNTIPFANFRCVGPCLHDKRYVDEIRTPPSCMYLDTSEILAMHLAKTSLAYGHLPSVYAGNNPVVREHVLAGILIKKYHFTEGFSVETYVQIHSGGSISQSSDSSSVFNFESWLP